MRELPRAGGIAPMSLMTYDDAVPVGGVDPRELVAAHMPPWNADEGYGEINAPPYADAQELTSS